MNMDNALLINSDEIPLANNKDRRKIFPDNTIDLTLRFREANNPKEKEQQESIRQNAQSKEPKKNKNDVLEALDSCHLTDHIYLFGNLNQDRSIRLIIGEEVIHQWPLKILLQEWNKVSYEIQSLRDNPKTAKYLKNQFVKH